MDLRKKYIQEKKLSNLRILHRNKTGEGKITDNGKKRRIKEKKIKKVSI